MILILQSSFPELKIIAIPEHSHPKHIAWEFEKSWLRWVGSLSMCSYQTVFKYVSPKQEYAKELDPLALKRNVQVQEPTVGHGHSLSIWFLGNWISVSVGSWLNVESSMDRLPLSLLVTYKPCCSRDVFLRDLTLVLHQSWLGFGNAART